MVVVVVGGGGMELSQNFLEEHFYCIFARIVKKQNLEKKCEHFFVTSQNSIG